MLILSCGDWRYLISSPTAILLFAVQDWSLRMYDLGGNTVLLIETLAEMGTGFGETMGLNSVDLKFDGTGTGAGSTVFGAGLRRIEGIAFGSGRDPSTIFGTSLEEDARSNNDFILATFDFDSCLQVVEVLSWLMLVSYLGLSNLGLICFPDDLNSPGSFENPLFLSRLCCRYGVSPIFF